MCHFKRLASDGGLIDATAHHRLEMVSLIDATAHHFLLGEITTFHMPL